jgi:Uma2 family endonuclease
MMSLMTAGPPSRPATYDDLVALADNLVGEIVDGVLYANPRPSVRHAIGSSALGGTLLPPFQFGDGGPGDWWIIDEPELHLGEDVLVPDMAGWHRERMPEIPEGHVFSVPPDWVCEVLSPRTARLDRVKKSPRYARAGVSHLWLLDPIARVLEVMARRDKDWLIIGLHSADDIVRAPPFDAIAIDLLRLWGERRGA